MRKRGRGELYRVAVVWLMQATCPAQQLPPEEIGAHFETTVVESRFGTSTVIPFGLRGEIYYLPTGADRLPKFEKLKPVGVIYTKGLNIPPRDFMEGFPGVTDRFEWFAIDYSGRFYVAKPGKYRFALLSDDGSKLYIDGRVVVKNDGVHAILREDGSITLTAGMHSIRLSYFQGPRFSISLILGVRRPDDKDFRIFNTDEFKPPADATQRHDRALP